MSVSRRDVSGFAKGFVVTVAVACLLLAAWMGVTAFQAYSAVEDLEGSAREATASAQSGQFAAAAAELPELADSAARLHGIVDSPPWSWMAGMPVVGSAVESVATIGGAADQTLAALNSDSAVASAAARMVVSDATTDSLAALSALSPTLARSADAAAAGAADVAAVRPDQLAGPLAGPVARAQERYLTLAAAIEASAGAAQALPTVLGLHGPRRWLVVLQNPAEARGTGGLVGAYALARVSDGRIRATTSDTNNSLTPERISLAGIPADTKRLWGEDDLAWLWGLNLDRHFPFAAELVQRTLPPGSGRVDEVLSLDPVSVAALLSLTGPVEVAGVEIDANNAADFLTREVYVRFPDSTRKDEVVAGLLEATIDRLAEERVDLAKLLQALGPLGGEQRVQLYSNDEAVQRGLALMPTSGVVPTEPGPWATVAINDYAGSKMSAYVDTSVAYRASTLCAAEGTPSAITVTVTNATPAGLKAYGAGRRDRFGGPPDSTRVDVGVYGPVGAKPRGFEVDGSSAAAVGGTSRSHPVWRRSLDLDRGQTRTFTVTFDEPYFPDQRPVLQPQPTARPMQVTVERPESCSP